LSKADYSNNINPRKAKLRPPPDPPAK